MAETPPFTPPPDLSEQTYLFNSDPVPPPFWDAGDQFDPFWDAEDYDLIDEFLDFLFRDTDDLRCDTSTSCITDEIPPHQRVNSGITSYIADVLAPLSSAESCTEEDHPTSIPQLEACDLQSALPQEDSTTEDHNNLSSMVVPDVLNKGDESTLTISALLPEEAGETGSSAPSSTESSSSVRTPKLIFVLPADKERTFSTITESDLPQQSDSTPAATPSPKKQNKTGSRRVKIHPLPIEDPSDASWCVRTPLELFNIIHTPTPEVEGIRYGQKNDTTKAKGLTGIFSFFTRIFAKRPTWKRMCGGQVLPQ